MNTKKLKNAACAMVTAALAGSCVSLPGSAADVKSDAEAVKYEFEDGSNNGGEIYTEGWKGNTQEDGSGEEMDLTGFSGSGFSYLDQKGTTVSVDVTVPERGL